MVAMRRKLLLLLLLILPAFQGRAADSAPAFDLSGPKVDVRVKRGAVTLPIGETTNLLAGDQLWIHPDFPESQSAQYVLIVAFLRGATNPPPPEWFTRVEMWSRTARDKGVFVTVPDEAQQAILFLAPKTGGDSSTLRNAVRDRPGAFVRAVQDLQAASWERMRLDAYLAEVKEASLGDLGQLKERTERAARSLGIRLDQQCFDKPSDQQAPCLMQRTDTMVLDDANAQSRVDQLTSSNSVDLMNNLSNSAIGKGGAYSPYVGAIVDTARIFGSLYTARFQYIPALALPIKDTLNLRLNVPPSFRAPKSVVVVALPPVGPAKLPALHTVNAAEHYCAQKPGLVLPTDGAPMVFATQLAHDLVLRIESKAGTVELPLKADPALGGLVLVHPAPTLPEGELTGVVRGKWGFDDLDGLHYHLRASLPGKWTLAVADQLALVVGREDTLHIEGENALCVERIEEKTAAGNPLKLVWKSPKPEQLEVVVPMKDATPGPVSLQIYQFGLDKPDSLQLETYAEAAALDHMTLSAGDTEAVLKGNRLDEVAKVTLDGITWTPTRLSRVQDSDQLILTTSSSTAAMEPGKRAVATILLQDGRELRVGVTVEVTRPRVTLLSKGAQEDLSATPSPVQLGSADDLPLDRKLVFFLRTGLPENFPRDEKVEVAAVDGSFSTTLSLSDGSLMLEDGKTAMGVIEPLARFGVSAFGPLHLRVISKAGVSGEWLPLGTLVRLPGFRDLRCPRNPAKPCTLTGTNLFLAASIADNENFDDAADLPPDFTGTQISVPHPVNGALYLKLRDDPQTAQILTLPITPINGAPAQTGVPAPTAPDKTEP